MRKINFITGAAGTGKSHYLRKLIAEETRPNLVLAPTGIAAVNIGGSTIHRAFKIDIDSGYTRQRWPDVEVVYVDEVSMLGMRTFESIVAGAPNADLVFVGDMAQLPPVKDTFWFESNDVRAFDLKIEKLTKQWRQAKDTIFAEKLNSIREGKADRLTMRWLYGNSTLPDENTEGVVLAWRNDTVRAINAERLLAMDGQLYESEAVYSGHMKNGDCTSEHLLSLKAGCQIIFSINDLEGRFYNGTRGFIYSIKNDDVVVCVDGHAPFVLERHTWKMKSPQELTTMRRDEIKYLLSNKDKKLTETTIMDFEQALRTGIEYITIGTTSQYPIKLAYAMTVHKAQGLTLGPIHVITSGFPGSHGIGYVALSRATCIDDVSFSKAPTLYDFKFDQRLKNYV